MKLIVEKDDIYAGLLLTDCYDNLNIVAKFVNEYQSGRGMKSFSTNTLTIKDKS